MFIFNIVMHPVSLKKQLPVNSYLTFEKRMKKNHLQIFTLLLILVSISTPLSSPCYASSFGDIFIDPSDGQLDLSNWLLDRDGFLPVPIIITEPAIGYGGGLALAYFHDKLGSRKGGPPSVSAVAGAATENGTWFAGGGHFGSWKNDTVRYTGGLGVGLIKMDYYGRSGNHGPWHDKGVRFETEAFFMDHELQFRIGESKIFAGFGLTYLDSTNTFHLYSSNLPPDLPKIKFDSRAVSLNGVLSYDSRDNIFTPSSGIATELKAMLFDDAWGSDDSFQKYKASFLYYTPLYDQFVLGFRGDARLIEGDAPFYSYPYIDMRGVKAMQYQGDMTLLSELELRWNVTSRWWLVGFGGVGKAYNDGDRDDSDTVFSKGLGFRYLIASKLGLQMGVDVASGPDDTAIYIQVGSSWALK